VVVVASTAGGYPVPEEDIKKMNDVLDVAKDKGTSPAIQLWLQSPMVAVASRHPTAGPLLRTMVQDNQRMLTSEHWPQERMSPPAYERLDGLNANVLFVVGDQDVESLRSGAEASAKRIKRSKVVTIKDADHLPQMEHPEAINKLLVEYISLNGC
jgi:pimeloyl-ACP methyl ester carboxylesterase